MARQIRKLEENVVNRIAAGEVIQRPANAIKEMIENSLDAKATLVQVTVKSGGLKLIQIQDDGIGIKKEDLDIVCERFTTSKLSRFEDLGAMMTYGFRGEALASISHVAHVTILTRTADSKCAYKATYADGKLTPVQHANAEPRPCAGNVGTQINVEDLFFNTPMRLKALKNTTEEFSKITDMVSRYAVHRAGVGFILKKHGDSNATVRTTSSSSRLDNISTIYGASIARELLEISHDNTKLGFTAYGYISNANYSAKKCTFILFINNRLVECSNLRKAIENVYAAYLPKNSHPFLYVSLQISPKNIDVNVHPTKHEVHFLYESEIIDAIQKTVENKLLGSNSSRTFMAQTFLPSTSASNKTRKDSNETREISSAANSNSHKKAYGHQLVRTDCRSQTLSMFMQPQTATASTLEGFTRDLPNSDLKENEANTSNSESFTTDDKEKERQSSNKQGEKRKYVDEKANAPLRTIRKRRELQLTSVKTLRNAIESDVAEDLQALMKGMKFVGCVSESHAAFQYETGLYLGNTTNLSKELFYQLIIVNFGNFEKFRLSNPAPIYDLAMLALDCKDSGWSEDDGSKEQLAQYITELLQSKCDMLADYFSIEIDNKGLLKCLPVLLDGYQPDLLGLPIFILRLATEVNWEIEKNCFEAFAVECSRFYAMRKGHDLLMENNSNDEERHHKTWKWKVENLLYSNFRSLFVPKRFLDDGTILKIADLKELYKVFERC